MGMMGQQRGGCVWLLTTHLAYSSQVPYAAGTEQGTGERTIPAHQAFIIQSGRKTVQQHSYHVPRRATPGGPEEHYPSWARTLLLLLLSRFSRVQLCATP